MNCLARVTFRYDDYSAAEQFPYEVDEALFNLFLSLNMPLLVAVTPHMTAAIRDPFNQQFFPLEKDTRRIELLRRGLQQGWQLALHGLTHQSTAALSGTEFKGVPLETQQEKLADGKRALSYCFPDVPVTVFVPPWNSYDEATVQSLSALGFRIMCASDSEFPRQQNGLTILPSLMSPRDFADYLDFYSLDDLLREVGSGCLVITMHQYEFRSLDRNDYVGLEKLAEIVQVLAGRAEIVTLDMATPVSHYLLKKHARFRAKIYFLQQVRNGRAIRSWKLTESMVCLLGAKKWGLALRSVAAQAYWWFDQTNLLIRAWFRPAKNWVRAQRNNRALMG